MTIEEAENEIGGHIQGGMIPKIESCITALKNGAKSAHIINGTKPRNLLRELIEKEGCGTLITF